MRLNLSNFDPNTGGEELGKISSFVQWTVQSIFTLTRVLRNNIALEDNVNGTKVSVVLNSGVQTVTNISGQVYGITPMRVRGDGLSSFEWGYTSGGRIFVTAEFRDGGTGITTDLYVWRD